MTKPAHEKRKSRSRQETPTGPTVFVVATPIGNLGDLSERAIRVLATADIIAAEDTRQARKLLSYIQQGHTALGTSTGAGGHTPELLPYHDHNEAKQAAYLMARIVERGEVLALVSDAGTPCISDPGYRLIEAARRAGVTVHPIPGPSAVFALASVSGLPTDRLLFIGFPPIKSKALNVEIDSWIAAGASVVFFESTRRLAKTLATIASKLPRASVAIGRELTKLHEEIFTGSIEEALDWSTDHTTLRGEASVMIDVRSSTADQLSSGTAGVGVPGGAADGMLSIQRAVKERLQRGESMKDILRGLSGQAAASGLGRKELYRLILEVMGR